MFRYYLYRTYHINDISDEMLRVASRNDKSVTTALFSMPILLMIFVHVYGCFAYFPVVYLVLKIYDRSNAEADRKLNESFDEVMNDIDYDKMLGHTG